MATPQAPPQDVGSTPEAPKVEESKATGQEIAVVSKDKPKATATRPKPKAKPKTTAKATTPAADKGKATDKVEAKAKADPKPKEPKVYVYGGVPGSGKPQPGANSRRLWKFLTEHLTKADLGRVKAELRRIQQEEFPDDRFVRWQRIVAAAEKVKVGPVKQKIGNAVIERKIDQALVRNLQLQDKEGKTGRDNSITIF